MKPRKLGENSGGGGPRSPRKKRRIGGRPRKLEKNVSGNTG